MWSILRPQTVQHVKSYIQQEQVNTLLSKLQQLITKQKEVMQHSGKHVPTAVSTSLICYKQCYTLQHLPMFLATRYSKIK